MKNIDPIRFDKNREDFETYKNSLKPLKIVDEYPTLLEELFLIRTPAMKYVKSYQKQLDEFITRYRNDRPIEELGEWFYFPWSGIMAHYLPNSEHQEIRTARNKNIITSGEQERFYNYRVAIAGMSVGSHPAFTIVMMGGCKKIKLADPDVLGPANLNRLRYDFTVIGEKKVDLVANTLWQMNPYGEHSRYLDGVTEDNLDEFLTDIDLLIEEVDDLEMKIRLRLEAKKLGIPVIMATDNGDNVIVDIERYDLDRDLELFNGIAGHITIEEFQQMRPSDLPKLATKIAGKDMVMPRMLDSLLEVGKSIYSWPQLGNAATLAGVALSYVVRRIAIGDPVRSGKLEVNLDHIFDPNYNEPENKKMRDIHRANFSKVIGLD